MGIINLSSKLINLARIDFAGNSAPGPVPPPEPDALKFTVNEGSQPGTITLTIPSGLTEQECTNIQYSLNGKTWVTFENHGQGLTITTPTLIAGDSVWFRGNATLISKSASKYSRFTTSSSTFKISASGSVMALMGNSEILTDYAFYRLFYGCTSLTTAPELPATTLVEYCYSQMFQNCTNLTTAPNIHATTLAGHCCSQMFQGCTSLINAPELHATILVNSCYENMFNGCTRLATAPELPATTLAYGCYGSMFNGCTNLTTAPALPATTLAEYCYYQMFYDCKSLINAPELHATTLVQGCYYSMFYDCASLTTAPELPATTLAEYCYSQMFQNCTSLTTTPVLPATILANHCYRLMFNGCTSLTTAPDLPAPRLANSCYYNMFSGCTSLNKITMLATNISASDCLYGWVQGVAATGTFIKDPAMTTLPTGDSGIPSGWIVKNYLGPLKFTVNEGSSPGTITLTIPSGLTQEECSNIEYSLDGRTWVTFVNEGNGLTITTPTLNAGDSVYFRGQATLISKSNSLYTRFTTSSELFRISASGSIMSLISNSEILTDYAFCYLFYDNKSLTTAPELPATTLAKGCYNRMFYGCRNLTTAPELPATTLADNCYDGMFWNCVGLTTAPELPATTLVSLCYNSMFRFCINLTTAPKLPATTLTSNCYRDMFNGCNQLNKITMLASNISVSNSLLNWVQGVAATGTFIKNAAMTTLPTGVNGIPSGWTVQDYAG